MHSAGVVIAGAIGVLVLIYLLPWFDERVRRAYSRWRRKQRDQREERERQERLARRSASQ
ncbi:membrane-associated phospholipid phosphatase [Caulobacter sp. 1776]